MYAKIRPYETLAARKIADTREYIV